MVTSIEKGIRVPSVTFRNRANGEWKNRSTAELFAGQRVVVFSLPGAFTPTCSSSHLPRYEELAPLFFEAGIDRILCVSVNDGFVMEAWAQDQNLQHVEVIADGNGEFTEGMGMLVDKSDLGFGKRSWRYAMLVEDGLVSQIFVEPDQPGDPFEVSDADTMLNFIAPNAKRPPEISLFTKVGCPFCAKAKAMLDARGYTYEEIVIGGGLSNKSLRTITGQETVPQIYIDGTHINGSEALDRYFNP